MYKVPSRTNNAVNLLAALIVCWFGLSSFFLADGSVAYGTLFLADGSFAYSTLLVVGSGLLLIGIGLWQYRKVGGTWPRLLFGLFFIFSVIYGTIFSALWW